MNYALKVIVSAPFILVGMAIAVWFVWNLIRK